jgi:hypothetical protein
MKSAALLLLAPSLCLAHTSFAPDDRVNYPSNYQVAQGFDLFISGEYLYWTAREDGLNYAQVGLEGHLKKISPEWRNGFRVGAGFNFPKSGFDLVALWTHFTSHASSSAHATNLLPVWAHPDNALMRTATFAKGSWSLNLNTVDLECSHSSWFGGCFSLRPFFGGRWLKIEQALHTRYDYATTPVVVGRLRSTSDFDGGGLRAGVDLRYSFGAGFSLSSLLSASLLYGEASTHFCLKEDATQIGKSHSSSLEGLSALQLNLVLGWDTHFWRDRCHIALFAGWEQNAFFGANRMSHYLGNLGQGNYFQEKGNLTLQGLIAGGRFDF